MFNLAQFATTIFSLTDKREFLVAYSGGMDSHVLLHALAVLRAENSEIKLRAVHINHGLSENAIKWEKHCRAICSSLDVELIIEQIAIKEHISSGHSVEAVARDFRYRALANFLRPQECLLTAHHADDQAETVLLQLFRGAGTSGLAAMPLCKEFLHSLLLRPLLNFTRSELHMYAENNNLSWIEDESNENIGIDRNYVRHQLLPIVEQRWPGIVTTLCRSAQHCAEASELLQDLAAQDYALIQGSKNCTLSASKLMTLSAARQNNVVRYWLRQLNLPLSSSKKIEHIISDVAQSRYDAMPLVHWQGAEVRRYRDDIYAMQPLTPHDSSMIITWDGESKLILPDNLGIIDSAQLAKAGLDLSQMFDLSIRFRQGGERIEYKEHRGAHCLKEFMQQNAIPPWLRDRIPLLYSGDKLVLVLTPDLLVSAPLPN